MGLIKKLLMKLIMMVIMVGLMGAAMRFAKPYIMKSAGMPEGMPGAESLADANFSSEESDLMGAIFKSALRLFTGQAKREDLANELSDKLYSGRPGAANMSELGIELERPGGSSAPLGLMAEPGADSSVPAGSTRPVIAPSASKAGRGITANTKPGAKPMGKPGAPKPADSASKQASDKLRDALLGRVWEKVKANPELSFVPVVIVGMFVFHCFRRRRSPEDDFMLPDLSNLLQSEAEAYDMKHAVHSLPAEDFELLVALIYQRQGYRVSMPAGLGGGDFMVVRKSERLLVQCKKLNQDHKVHVDRVRELHEAAVAAGVTRGVYVASCGFSWDARNFAKTKGVIVINARILDTLITEAFQKTGEDFSAVSEWAPKLMTKVKLTPPLCPACEASMDEVNVSAGSVWVCSQRPECRGRRSARKCHQVMPAGSTPKAKAEPKTPVASPRNKPPQTTSIPQKSPTPPPCEESPEPMVMGGRARTICPSN